MKGEVLFVLGRGFGDATAGGKGEGCGRGWLITRREGTGTGCGRVNKAQQRGHAYLVPLRTLAMQVYSHSSPQPVTQPQ